MKHVLAGVSAVLIILTGFVVMTSPRAQAQPVGGWADTLTWFEQPNQAQAILDLAGGTMDVYMFQLRTAGDIASAKANPELWTIDTGGSLNNLFINPVRVDQSLAPGVGNPFTHREVREAMNYVLDRDFITREVAPGQMSMTTIENRLNPEYGREAVFFSELERKYAFNPTLGGQMITNALRADADYTTPGSCAPSATCKWLFKGGTLTLNFVIRTEDIRRNIGDYIAERVESLGFNVNRLYRPGGAAFPIVYNGPPDTGAWHLYTEGWASTALLAWADGDPNFFFNGGEGSNIWNFYQPEQALQDVATRLLNAQYNSLAERQSLFRQAANLTLQNSVRAWVVAGATFAVSKRVTGMVYDLSGGVWGPLASRTARFASAGGNMQMGQRINFLSPWNPWQGFGWLYDQLQAYAFTDAAVLPHPHTGLYMPIRSDFVVYAPSASTSVALPATALTWDNTTQGFKTVAPGTRSKSIVNYTYTFGKWHDGSDFTMDDVLYETALAYRRANATGDVHAKDADAATSSSILFTTLLKGFVVNGNTISMYFDYWHPDPSTIASIGGVAFPITPWTASELGLSTVFDDTCRVSEVTAQSEGKDALDLTKGACLARMDVNLPTYMAAIHRPPGLDADITLAEATARWTALQNFRTTYLHVFASNGPYILSTVNEAAKQSIMTRDPNYPFTADRYDAFLVPRVPRVAFGPAPTVLIGQAAPFTFTVRLAGGDPYDQFTSTFLVVNPATGAILYQGTPTKAASGSYQITLLGNQTKTMVPGAYDMRVIAVGNEAAIPVITTQSFIAIPDVDTIVAQLRGEITTTRDTLEKSLNDQRASTQALQSQLAGLQLLVGVLVIVAILALIIGVVAMMRVMRGAKGPKPETEGKQAEEI